MAVAQDPSSAWSNLESTTRLSGPLAAFVNRSADDLGKPGPHREAHGWMVARQSRERTCVAADDVVTVALDVCLSAELCVHQLAGLRHSRAEIPRRSSAGHKTESEPFTSAAQNRVELVCGK